LTCNASKLAENCKLWQSAVWLCRPYRPNAVCQDCQDVSLLTCFDNICCLRSAAESFFFFFSWYKRDKTWCKRDKTWCKRDEPICINVNKTFCILLIDVWNLYVTVPISFISLNFYFLNIVVILDKLIIVSVCK